jgi:hypothetical protein
LEIAVRSVLNQTLADFELVLVDDGSTDGSDEILAALAAEDQRIRVVTHSSNMGLVAALNTGLKCSQGQFIARMDADDVCAPVRLSLQTTFLLKHNRNAKAKPSGGVDQGVDVLGTPFVLFSSLEEPGTREAVPESPPLHEPAAAVAAAAAAGVVNEGGSVGGGGGRGGGEGEDVRKFWQSAIKAFPSHPCSVHFQMFFHCAVAHPSVMARAHTLRAVGGYSAQHPHAEDYDLWHRILLRRCLEKDFSERSPPAAGESKAAASSSTASGREREGGAGTGEGGAGTGGRAIKAGQTGPEACCSCHNTIANLPHSKDQPPLVHIRRHATNVSKVHGTEQSRSADGVVVDSLTALLKNASEMVDMPPVLASARWSLGAVEPGCTSLAACVACLRRPKELVAVRQAELCFALVQFVADIVVGCCGSGGTTASPPCPGCIMVQEESIKRQAELCTAALQVGASVDCTEEGSQEAAAKLFQMWLISAQKLNPMLAMRLMATMRKN